jgi:hypothetical protein
MIRKMQRLACGFVNYDDYKPVLCFRLSVAPNVG